MHYRFPPERQQAQRLLSAQFEARCSKNLWMKRDVVDPQRARSRSTMVTVLERVGAWSYRVRPLAEEACSAMVLMVGRAAVEIQNK
jgi:hypothetical protein